MRKQAGLFLLGTLGLNAARLVREFLVLQVLGVGTAVGVAWAVLSLIRQYGAFSDLGASNALARLLPASLEKDGRPASERLAGTAWTTAMASTAVVGAVLLGVGLAAGVSPALLAAAAPMMLVLWLDKQFLVSVTILRSEGRWPRVTSQYVLLGLLELGLGWAGAKLFGLVGAVGGTALALALVGAIFWRASDLVLRPAWDRAVAKSVLGLGAVMLAYGLANIAIHSVDRVVLAAARAPAEWITSYHLAAYAAVGVAQVAAGAMSVYASRLFRAGAEERSRFAPALGIPTLGLTALGILAGAGSLGLLAVALPFVAKGQAPTVGVLLLLVAAEVVLCWTMPAENALVGLNLGGKSVWIRYVGIGFAFAAGWAALAMGGGLAGVAAARLGAQLLVSVVVLGMACRALGVGAGRPMAGLLAPAGYSLLAGAAVHATVGLPAPQMAMREAAISGSVLLLAMAPLALALGWGPLRRPLDRAFRTGQANPS